MPEFKFEQWENIQSEAVVRREVLEAAKEALVQIQKKFSLTRELSVRAANDIVAAVRAYREPKPNEQQMPELRDIVLHVAEEVLARNSMNVPDIFNEFEKTFLDHLPGESGE